MLRDVVEDSHFTDEFDLLRKSYPEMDAVHTHITWALGSDPRVGIKIEGHPLNTIRMYITTPIGNTPSFSVLYRFTHNQVILLSIADL